MLPKNADDGTCFLKPKHFLTSLKFNDARLDVFHLQLIVLLRTARPEMAPPIVPATVGVTNSVPLGNTEIPTHARLTRSSLKSSVCIYL